MEIAILNETLPVDAIFVLRAMGGGGFSLDLETVWQRSGLRAEAFNRAVGLLLARGLANRGAVSGSCVALYPTLRGCPLALAAADPDSVVSRTLAAHESGSQVHGSGGGGRGSVISSVSGDGRPAHIHPLDPARVLRTLLRLIQVENKCNACGDPASGVPCREPLKCACWLELLAHYDNAGDGAA